jgi:uncharacterized paraquat-inducible protein A
MQVETARSPAEEVRCLACHVVYELPVEGDAREARACPECGAVAWLAATIPLPEPEPIAAT